MLSKEEKKAMMKAYKEKQIPKYVLQEEEAQELMDYLQEVLEEEECDHTLKYTRKWLLVNIADEMRRKQIEEEMRRDGGYCDCEVIANCYENYDLA